ncbi:MAG: flippase-like domain-containing protein [Deltaproteobacteria bacterium]|nr:flippase-like domain-containing protein [Deltaproteobacteria bacterium]
MSLVLMAVIFTVLIRVGGWDDLRQAFSEARPVYILAAIFAHFCVIFGGAPLLWHFIVTLLGARPPLSEAYRLWLGVLCLRAILPMKAGSFVVGPNYLRLHHGLPFSRGAGSMALYHFINFYTLWVYLAVGLWWTGRAGVWLLALLTGAIGVVPFILPWMRVPVDWIGKRHRRVGDLLGHLVGGFTDISLPMRLRLIGIGCVFQLVDFMAIGLCLRAAGIDVPLAELLWRAPGVFLIANLPVTFMGLGTREAAMVAFFAPFGGKAAALAGGLIMSFSISFVPALVSLFFLPQALRMGLFSEMTNDE